MAFNKDAEIKLENAVAQTAEFVIENGVLVAPTKVEYTVDATPSWDNKLAQTVDYVIEDGVAVIPVLGNDLSELELFIRGDMNSWGTSNAYKLAYDSSTNSLSWEWTIEKGKGFKVSTSNFGSASNISDSPTLVNDGGSSNCPVAETGTYKVLVCYVEDVLTCTVTKVE